MVRLVIAPLMGADVVGLKRDFGGSVGVVLDARKLEEACKPREVARDS